MTTLPGDTAPAAWGGPRSKTVSWHDPHAVAAEGRTRSGLEFIQAMIDGAVPPPPIASLFGFRMTMADVGVAQFACDPDESAYNPIGVIHGGLVCTLLDSALGCAAHTTLPAGVGYTSVEIKVNYLRPVDLDSGPIVATGRVIKPGRRVIFTEGEVRDRHDKVVATATSTLLVFPLPGAEA